MKPIRPVSRPCFNFPEDFTSEHNLDIITRKWQELFSSRLLMKHTALPSLTPMQACLQSVREAMNLFYADRARYPSAPMLTEGCRSYVPNRVKWDAMWREAKAEVEAWGNQPSNLVTLTTQDGYRWELELDCQEGITWAVADREDLCWYQAQAELYRKGWLPRG